MATESDKAEKSKRRVVKKAETVREVAEKSQQPVKPKKQGILGLAGHYVAVPFKVIGRPFKKLGRYKVFRIIGLILVPPYFRQSWKELRQVTWPKRRESLQLTSAVIIFSVIFGVVIALVDFVLDKLFKEVLLK